MKKLSIILGLGLMCSPAIAQTGFKTDIVKTEGAVKASGFKAEEVKYNANQSTQGRIMVESGNGMASYSIRKTSRSFYWIEKTSDLSLGTNTKPASDNEVEIVQAFLNGLNPSLFGATELSFKHSRTDNIQGELVHRFTQTYMKLPIFDAAVVAHVSNQALSDFIGSIEPIQLKDVKAGLSETQALDE